MTDEPSLGVSALPDALRRFHAAVMRRVMQDLSGVVQRRGLTPAQVSSLFHLRGREQMTVGSWAKCRGSRRAPSTTWPSGWYRAAWWCTPRTTVTSASGLAFLHEIQVVLSATLARWCSPDFRLPQAKLRHHTTSSAVDEPVRVRGVSSV